MMAVGQYKSLTDSLNLTSPEGNKTIVLTRTNRQKHLISFYDVSFWNYILKTYFKIQAYLKEGFYLEYQNLHTVFIPFINEYISKINVLSFPFFTFKPRKM